jgi:hypothetical protein
VSLDDVQILSNPDGSVTILEGKAPYIVVRDGVVVQRLDAFTAAEARSLQTEPGDLYIQLGGG